MGCLGWAVASLGAKMAQRKRREGHFNWMKPWPHAVCGLGAPGPGGYKSDRSTTAVSLLSFGTSRGHHTGAPGEGGNCRRVLCVHAWASLPRMPDSELPCRCLQSAGSPGEVLCAAHQVAAMPNGVPGPGTDLPFMTPDTGRWASLLRSAPSSRLPCGNHHCAQSLRESVLEPAPLEGGISQIPAPSVLCGHLPDG